MSKIIAAPYGNMVISVSNAQHIMLQQYGQTKRASEAAIMTSAFMKVKNKIRSLHQGIISFNSKLNMIHIVLNFQSFRLTDYVGFHIKTEY